ncbi:MAG: N-acetylglucosamine-6-phosphate deacetylase [Candidatus Hadarchaeum sp.]|uniref:N-acetylglucosamine-6-phosphate deacetylase n=1 Tax=Candidatus Hadarchaeum sp. TaxID=2883567 RepID=UPI00317A616D
MKGDLLVVDGRIAAVLSKRPRVEATEMEVEGLYVAPGFIDLHVHGGGGKNFSEGTGKAIQDIVEFHMAHGTTGLVATIETSPLQVIKKVLKKVAEVNLPVLLGVHLEGPFLSPKQKGAHDPNFLLPPSLKIWERSVKGFEHLVKIVTLAPEVPGALALLPRIQEIGAIPSLGHSDATYAEALGAVRAGVRLFTHLGNAMRGLHHREPGAVGAALDSDAYVELICDGAHLHQAFVRLVARIKGYDRICLVTDAISAAGLPDGQCFLGGLPVLVQGGVARLPDGTLAGSTLTLDQAVRNFWEFTGCSLPEAVRCATLTPAQLLEVDERKGSLEVGKDADLVIFDKDFNVHYTILGGKILYVRDIRRS